MHEIEKGYRACSCKCGAECIKLHKRFTWTDDPRGKYPIHLDLSGSSESKIKRRKLLVKNLNINEKSVKNWKQMIVMRHHWSTKQLHHFYGGPTKRFPSTPMPHCAVYKIAHSVKNSLFAKRKESHLHFNIPNYPMNLARKDAACIEKHSRISNRRENLVD